MSMRKGGEIRLRGIPGSPGIAIGRAFLFERTRPRIPHRHLAPEEVEGEIVRFREALERSERELHKIIEIARQKVDPDAAAIFEAQLLMLRDEHIYERIEQRIRSLTAQGRLQGIVVGSVPVLLLLAMTMIDPDMMMAFFRSRAGVMLLVLAGLLEIGGALLIRKIMRIEV